MNSHDWNHPNIARYPEILGAEELRSQSRNDDYDSKCLKNGGWHCSWCFKSVQEYVTKLESFSHTEMDRPEFKVETSIVRKILTGQDFFGRSEPFYMIPEWLQDKPSWLSLSNPSHLRFMMNRTSWAKELGYNVEELRNGFEHPHR